MYFKDKLKNILPCKKHVRRVFLNKRVVLFFTLFFFLFGNIFVSNIKAESSQKVLPNLLQKTSQNSMQKKKRRKGNKKTKKIIEEKREPTILYPENFSLQILSPTYEGKKEKKYLTNVVQSLLYDFLSIQEKVWFSNVSPSSIIYNKNDFLVEDSYNYNGFLKSGLFPLKIKKDTPIQKIQKKDFILHLHIKEVNFGFQLNVKFDRLEKSLYKTKIILEENKIAQQVKDIADEIRAFLSGPKQGALQISSTPSQASVYLNGIYFGKTPFSVSHIAESSYTLTLRKENYKPFVQNILIESKKNTFSFVIPPEKGKGSIALYTTPAGAKVYVDQEYMGVTPLVLENLSMGFYRIGIQKENYEDYQNDIEISEQKFSYNFNLPLKHILSNRLTYEQLVKRNLNGSKAMFLLSAAFMITGVAMLVERDKHLQQEYRSVYTTGTQEWEKNQNKIEMFENFAIGFFIGTGISLITGGVLYVRYLNILSKSLITNQPKTSANLIAYANKTQAGFSFSVTTRY